MRGTCIGKSDWLTIDQARINQFATATNDQQWIHVDPARAEKGPYSGPIAHGLLTLSMIPYFSSQVSYAPAGTLMVVNYGFNRVRMNQPGAGGGVDSGTSWCSSALKRGGRTRF